jgi:hypothetical protein
MSSPERLALKGKLTELQKKEEYLFIKISGSSDLLRSHLIKIVTDKIENIDEKAIEVFANEIVRDIKKIKDIKNSIHKITNELR